MDGTVGLGSGKSAVEGGGAGSRSGGFAFSWTAVVGGSAGSGSGGFGCMSVLLWVGRWPAWSRSAVGRRGSKAGAVMVGEVEWNVGDGGRGTDGRYGCWRFGFPFVF